MQKLLFTLLFLSTLFLSINAQNYLMDHGRSGYHLGTQISYNSFENYYAFLPGYTYNGRITFGLDIGKNQDKVNLLNSTVLRPNLSYLVIKQNDELPISVDVNVAYQFDYVTQVMYNARTMHFGLGAYHAVSKLEGVKIIPGIFIEGRRATHGPNPALQETTVMSYGFQSSIRWDKFYFTPIFKTSEKLTTLSAKLGIILDDNN